jgi:hypothetical protein
MALLCGALAHVDQHAVYGENVGRRLGMGGLYGKPLKNASRKLGAFAT